MPAIVMAYEERREMLRTAIAAMMLPAVPTEAAAPVVTSEPEPAQSVQEIKSILRMVAGKT